MADSGKEASSGLKKLRRAIAIPVTVTSLVATATLAAAEIRLVIYSHGQPIGTPQLPKITKAVR
jgi:hypothetical protein